MTSRVLHLLVRTSTIEKNICAFSTVSTGFEDCPRLATLRTECNFMKQHQNCSFANIQAQTFRIVFQILSRLANSILLKLCSDMVRQIVAMVVSTILLRQDHRCFHRDRQNETDNRIACRLLIPVHFLQFALGRERVQQQDPRVTWMELQMCWASDATMELRMMTRARQVSCFSTCGVTGAIASSL